MKALEKDRTRRFGSASEFAADIQRHLHDEAVLAGPPTALYRSRKFLRKHQHTQMLQLNTQNGALLNRPCRPR